LSNRLTGLEQEDGHLPKVEVDEMLGLVGHVRTEVAAHNAVPRGVVLAVKLLLDVTVRVGKEKVKRKERKS